MEGAHSPRGGEQGSQQCAPLPKSALPYPSTPPTDPPPTDPFALSVSVSVRLLSARLLRPTLLLRLGEVKGKTRGGSLALLDIASAEQYRRRKKPMLHMGALGGMAGRTHTGASDSLRTELNFIYPHK